MNGASANPSALDVAEPQPPRERWSRTRWLTIIVLIFAAHIGFIFALGERKQIVPRVVTNVPALQFAGDSEEWLALNDPALFALPNPKDFASAVWLKMPDVKPPTFRWTEPPRWLPLDAENLGAVFIRFMRTNYFARPPLDFKPPPKLSEPILTIQPALAQNSTLRVEGELAQRRLLNQINLPSLLYNDVLAPSVVQALVDGSGNVVSVVLLTPGGFDAADQRALELARTARFAPAPRLTVGQLIFNWHTIPTNAPVASP
jgi:TonB family protein